MSVENEVRPWSKGGNGYRAQRDGRDEVAIHDVDMDDVGIGFNELDLVGQMGEVRCEDGCRQLPHGGGLERRTRWRPSAGLLERRHEHPVGAVSVRPEAGARRRVGAFRSRGFGRGAGGTMAGGRGGSEPSGPGVSIGARSDRWRTIASDVASVSALGNVQTEYTSRPPGRS